MKRLDKMPPGSPFSGTRIIINPGPKADDAQYLAAAEERIKLIADLLAIIKEGRPDVPHDEALKVVMAAIKEAELKVRKADKPK